MKLVMFTPAITASAIGRMASLVTQALVRMGHAVTVIRAEGSSLLSTPTHDFGATLVPWTQSAQVEHLLRTADAVIYQIGDNYVYHQGCLEWLPRAPGVICLHDFFLGHLFTGWAEHHMKEARSTLRAWYGDESADRFFNYHSSDTFIAGTKDTTPMTEWVASMGHAIITHSNWGLSRVLGACPGPVEVVPLAYDTHRDVGGPVPPPLQDTSPASFRVLTVGHVNPNKRAESVIRAIGNSPILREHATYRLVGATQPAVADQLLALADDLDVRLVISGEVDADALSSALAEADVVACLRWPSLEAASASAIEAMLYSKPVVVTNVGFYAELPDACVRKISQANEIAELQQALECLYRNGSERTALGTTAAHWASNTFTADHYAQRIVAVSLAAQRAAPIIGAVQDLTAQQQRWGASERVMMLDETLAPLRLFEGCHLKE